MKVIKLSLLSSAWVILDCRLVSGAGGRSEVLCHISLLPGQAWPRFPFMKTNIFWLCSSLQRLVSTEHMRVQSWQLLVLFSEQIQRVPLREFGVLILEISHRWQGHLKASFVRESELIYNLRSKTSPPDSRIVPFWDTVNYHIIYQISQITFLYSYFILKIMLALVAPC